MQCGCMEQASRQTGSAPSEKGRSAVFGDETGRMIDGPDAALRGTQDVVATPLWGVWHGASRAEVSCRATHPDGADATALSTRGGVLLLTPTALELLGRVDRKVTRFGGASPTRLRLRRGQARPAPPRKPGVAAAPRSCHRLRDEPIHLGTLFRLRDAPRQHRRAGLLLRRGVATTTSFNSPTLPHSVIDESVPSPLSYSGPAPGRRKFAGLWQKLKRGARLRAPAPPDTKTVQLSMIVLKPSGRNRRGDVLRLDPAAPSRRRWPSDDPGRAALGQVFGRCDNRVAKRFSRRSSGVSFPELTDSARLSRNSFSSSSANLRPPL